MQPDPESPGPSTDPTPPSSAPSGERKHWVRHTGKMISELFARIVPDPFVLAILLTALTYILGVTVESAEPVAMLEYWQGDGGFWRLLAFGMQMCLILMTGHALASAPPVARALDRLASIPRTPSQAVFLTSFAGIVLGLLNWGLGLCAGALFARQVARAMAKKGIAVHYPLLAAAGYTSMVVWHGGFSGSAPLKVTGMRDLEETLGADLAARVGEIPLELTVLSPLNLVATGGLLILLPLFMSLFCPKNRDRVRPIGDFDVPEDAPPPEANPQSFLERLEYSQITSLLLLVPAWAYLGFFFADGGLSRLDLNRVNLIFLTVGMFLHGSPRHYLAACENAVRPCSAIILQFPLYAGIMGMMAGSGLAVTISDFFARSSNCETLPFLTFLSAGFLNLFVPSGGGQWAIQGQIMLDACLRVGADTGRVVIAFAYGDGLTNAIQPFWALPLLAITGMKARDVVGYTAVGMVLCFVWWSACLWLF